MRKTLIAGCVFGLGAAMAHLAHAEPSHCAKRVEAQCTSDVACRWVPAREPAMGVSPRKAHCRLDVRAAAELARDKFRAK